MIKLSRASGRSRSHESGFSLIEVLVSMLIAMGMLLSVMLLFQRSLTVHVHSAETTDSLIHASSHLEALVSLPSKASALNPGTSEEELPRNFYRRTRIVANDPAPGSKTIKVSVWRKGSTRKVTLIAVRPR